MWEYFEVLLKRNNLRISDVQKGTGIPYSTFIDWKAGRYTPKMDKMKKIADFFGVSVDYLMTGRETPKESTSGKGLILYHKTTKNGDTHAGCRRPIGGYTVNRERYHSNHIRTASMRFDAPVVPAIWPSLATICQPMP